MYSIPYLHGLCAPAADASCCCPVINAFYQGCVFMPGCPSCSETRVVKACLSIPTAEYIVACVLANPESSSRIRQARYAQGLCGRPLLACQTLVSLCTKPVRPLSMRPPVSIRGDTESDSDFSREFDRNNCFTARSVLLSTFSASSDVAFARELQRRIAAAEEVPLCAVYQHDTPSNCKHNV